MKIIFLDFDGVLNGCEENMGTSAKGFEYGTPLWCAQQIEPKLVELLNQIVEATGALVVISSSWRNAHETNKLREMLAISGFKGFVVGVTPRLYRTADGETFYRHDEIQMWLDAVGDAVESFVILDDFDMGHLNHRAVKCVVQTGMRPNQVADAIRILNQPV